MYMTDDTTIEQAVDASRASLADICKEYRLQHQAYWFMVDKGNYPSTDDYRARHHWRKVRALRKRIKEQGKAEGVDGFAFYSALLGD